MQKLISHSAMEWMAEKADHDETVPAPRAQRQRLPRRAWFLMRALRVIGRTYNKVVPELVLTLGAGRGRRDT